MSADDGHGNTVLLIPSQPGGGAAAMPRRGTGRSAPSHRRGRQDGGFAARHNRVIFVRRSRHTIRAKSRCPGIDLHARMCYTQPQKDAISEGGDGP